MLKTGFPVSAFIIKCPTMKSNFQFFLTIILLICCTKIQAEEKVTNPENDLCLKCHTHQTFTFHNSITNQEANRMMNPFYILDKDHLEVGVHAIFNCTDCHSSEYSTYPHKAELKLDPLATCLDCHGGDESYAVYQFEKIDEEFKKSIHFQKSGESFTCSKCHSQHYYNPKSRRSSEVTEIVAFSNEMCISCHRNNIKFQLVSDQLKPELSQIHEWLPNQELHFKHVRCIECHTEVVDSLAVSHNILPKEKALKKCYECHSKNSMLEASLYKYHNLKKRTEEKKINTIVSNKSYVIGAYQSTMLNNTITAIFFLILLGIAIHLIFRIVKK
jgi:hypothetical protein